MNAKCIKTQLRRTAAFGSVVSLLLTALILAAAALLFTELYHAKVANTVRDELAALGVNNPTVVMALEGKNFIGSIGLRSLLPMLSILVMFPLMAGITSWIVSRRMSRRIMMPLNELKAAADHVVEGDLDYRINYAEPNEFGMVCDAFSDMQIHLKSSLAMNSAQEQSRKELLAGISHDLRTPLTAIRGYVKGLQDGIASTPEKQGKYLDTILGKTFEMEKLVERLFLYSKLDAGSESFCFATVVADEYLAGFIDVIRQDVAHKGMNITYQPLAETGLPLKLDCDQMYRVFTNILDNSAKYKTRETGTVTITTMSEAGMFTIEFADDGPGVPEETLDKLFETFYRTDPARTATSKGSGLGLSIAEKIVTAHGGSIGAINRQGLVVTVCLPVQKGERV